MGPTSMMWLALPAALLYDGVRQISITQDICKDLLRGVGYGAPGAAGEGLKAAEEPRVHRAGVVTVSYRCRNSIIPVS